MLHLWNLDEPHERNKKLFMGLSGKGLFDYINAVQKFWTHASSGNSVIYNSSVLGLCSRNFFLLPHIPTVVLDLVLHRYRFGCVHMEICIVAD